VGVAKEPTALAPRLPAAVARPVVHPVAGAPDLACPLRFPPRRKLWLEIARHVVQEGDDAGAGGGGGDQAQHIAEVMALLREAGGRGGAGRGGGGARFFREPWPGAPRWLPAPPLLPHTHLGHSCTRRPHPPPLPARRPPAHRGRAAAVP
jgi:hypothetical protein